MGGSASTQVIAATTVINQTSPVIDKDLLVRLLMPIYYTTSPLLPHEKDRALKAWKLVSSGLAPAFHRRKKEDPLNTPCASPPEFFGQRLVMRFISVHPVSQQMFSFTTIKQGSLFYRMIAFIAATLDEEDKFEAHFTLLARTHNRMGVRAVEYGIFGEVLFHILRLTLGEDYDAVAHSGWIKIYSRILRIVIPIAMDYEIANKPTIDSLTTKRVSNLMANGGKRFALKADDPVKSDRTVSVPDSD